MRSDGLHTLEAISLISFNAFSRWSESQPGDRPLDYLYWKHVLTGKMFDVVERIVPGIRERVVFQTMSTPLSNMHFVGASEGAIYGVEHTLRNLGPFSFPVRTKIDGLFQCGASTISPGIQGVTTSGLHAAAAALECTPAELLTAKGPPLEILPSPEASQPLPSRAARHASKNHATAHAASPPA
jgi:hypothetical protein